ncbi:hypothetical protein OB236_39665 [Paenibacillus sp. WQ 127069]|uniref:Tetratricopeptide repeat protein n=1 Tax=Paenibacillus baimaensis TaxID=2982185 RepID=A0ABT2UX67_9BACL|nr:tetratricopeptide repeat protein [Paenibacillus sp. WQ 127069]MCU6798264.1 hypothetical protein [Paenibacillus sp. WQ 127069]
MLNDIEVNIDIKGEKIINHGQLPLIVIDSPVGKRLKGLKHIKLDLFIIQGLFQSFINLEDCEENYILQHSLWFAGVTTYGRCFTEAAGRGIKLEKSKYVTHLEESKVRTHDEIMEQRNKYIAHADDNNYEGFEVFGVVDPETNKLLGLTNNYHKTVAVNRESIKRYIELINEIIIQVAHDDERASSALLKQISSIQVDELRVINPFVDNKKELSKVYAMLGTKYCLNNQDFDNGIEFLTRAINLDPEDDGPYINRANAFETIGDINNQLSDLNKAYEINPNSPNVNNNLGNFLTNQRRYNEAIPFYLRALSLDNDYLNVYNNITLCLFYLNRINEALSYINKGILLDESNPEFYVTRALCFEGLGLNEEMEADIAKARKLGKSI